MAAVPPCHQALQEMRDAVDVAAALNGGTRARPSEASSDWEFNYGSASLSSQVTTDIMPRITPRTADEIL
ncbi:hypothetical protein NDU88_008967 [Pleurodeles waltl]|uniref:Uncharacterized protein n=1 Tax=Pleurodeles waltl TaxID=8319 RepID=A0AAV7NFR2_PLEWA|nr:hypothetical protein NDU88_008967 [Pleurodeles waltl]